MIDGKELKMVDRGNTFAVSNESGDEQVFNKLCEFDSPETGKHYLIYTDNSTDENGNLQVLASVVTMNGENMGLDEISTPEELEIVRGALMRYQEEVQKALEAQKDKKEQ